MAQDKSGRVPSESAIRGAFEGLLGKAEKYVGDPAKAKELLSTAKLKIGSLAGDRGPLAEVWGFLTAFVRMFQAYYHREYTDVPRGSIVAIVAALIYFVVPFDMLPDFIPVAGFADDAALIAFVVARVRVDIEKFLAWEIERGKPDDGSASQGPGGPPRPAGQ